MNTTPQELHELLQAITSVMAGLQDAKSDDGKVSRVELVTVLLHRRNDIRNGIGGISAVPGELKTLDAEGMQILRADVIKSLHSMGFSHRAQDKADAIMRVATACVDCLRVFQDDTPVAVPA